MTLILKAIQAAATRIAGGDAGDDLVKLYKSYEELMFPETVQKRERTTLDVKELMRKEYERGPMKVQSKSYARSKKR